MSKDELVIDNDIVDFVLDFIKDVNEDGYIAGIETRNIKIKSFVIEDGNYRLDLTILPKSASKYIEITNTISFDE